MTNNYNNHWMRSFLHTYFTFAEYTHKIFANEHNVFHSDDVNESKQKHYIYKCHAEVYDDNVVTLQFNINISSRHTYLTACFIYHKRATYERNGRSGRLNERTSVCARVYTHVTFRFSYHQFNSTCDCIKSVSFWFVVVA